MTQYRRLPETERLALAELALNNAKNDAGILGVLAVVGYPEARLDEGLALLADARQADRTQDRERGEQFDATDALSDAAQAARKTYMKHVKIARTVLHDDRGALADLGLLGPREDDLEGWLDQARNFYSSALAKPSLQAKLDPHGFTVEVLTAGQTAIEGVETERREAREEREDSESATVAKEKALRLLDRYMGSFFKVARAAFEDEPQRLERLGLTVPS